MGFILRFRAAVLHSSVSIRHRTVEGVLRRLSSGRQRCRYKTYPHVDYVERAAEATRLIAGMINKTCRPTMAARKPPMIPMV